MRKAEEGKRSACQQRDGKAVFSFEPCGSAKLWMLDLLHLGSKVSLILYFWAADHERNESAPASTDGERWCFRTKAVPTRSIFTALKSARMASRSAPPRSVY